MKKLRAVIAAFIVMLITNEMYAATVSNTAPEVCVNSSVNINCIGGTGAYQWQINSSGWTNISNGGAYSGATGVTLTITPPDLLLNGAEYRCIVGSDTTTNTAILTVDAQPTADAGLSQDICGSLNATLAGSDPSPYNGTWTMTSGSGSATYLPNAQTYNASVTATTYGAKIFRWTVTNGLCTAQSSVTINFAQAANAGANQDKCGTSSTTLAGNSPSVGTGTWTMTSGTGTESYNPNGNTANAVVTVTNYGSKTFQWTITNGTCSTNSSVTINFAEAANAGTGIDICGTNSALLAGNTPSAGSGTWTMPSGSGTASYNPNANTANATATVTQYGAKTFRWTITNGGCSSNSSVNVNFAETAAAGTDQDKCGTPTAGLNGNNPSTGTGTWLMVLGTGTASYSPNANARNANVTVTNYGAKTFTWTITNGSCNTKDSVNIGFAEDANAGTDQYKCGTLTAMLAGNAPSIGTGTWTQTGGPGTTTYSNPNDPASGVTVDIHGLYTYQWRIVNGTCNSQNDMQVRFARKASAGPDQDKCGTLSAILAGNDPGSGTGIWSKISGPGNVTFTPDVNTPAATATVTAYGSYSLRYMIDNSYCDTYDTVIINYAETANAGTGQNKCGTLTTTFSGNAPSVGTGTWTQTSGPGTSSFVNDHSNTSNVTVSLYGTYTFMWTIVNGTCNTQNDVIIDFNEDPTFISAGPDQLSSAMCNILSTSLSATAFSYQTGSEHTGSTRTWSYVSGPVGSSFASATSPNTIVTVTLYGDYVFRWNETNSTCSRNDNVNISFYALPAPVASYVSPVVEGGPLSLTGAPAGLVSYSWTGPLSYSSLDRSPVVSLNATLAMSGNYILTVVDNHGCTKNSTTNVVMNALPLLFNVTGGGIYCPGTSGVVVGLNGSESGVNYQLVLNGINNIGSPVAGTGSPITFGNQTSSGTYTVIATNAATSVTRTMTGNTNISQYTLPVAQASNNGPVCIGDSVKLTGGKNGLSYAWTGPNVFSSSLQNPKIPNAASAMAGNYIITVTDAHFCTNKDTTLVIINPLPNPQFSPAPKTNYSTNEDPTQLHAYGYYGGTFWGRGVVSYDSTFHPDVSGAGPNTLYYTYTYLPTGCTNTVSFNVNVDVTVDSIEGFAANNVVCISSPVLLIIGKNNGPNKGTLSGKGISLPDSINHPDSAYFDPKVAHQGKVSITYIYNKNSVSHTVTKQITVDSVAIPYLETLDTTWAFCYSISSVQIDAKNLIPDGGANKWWGPAGIFSSEVNSSTFYPKLGTQNSTYIIKYLYTSPFGCSCDTVYQTVKIKSLPIDSIDIACPFFNVDDGKNDTLKGKKYSNGTFSGLGVVLNTDSLYEFSASQAGVKNDIVITYEFTDPATRCSNSTTANFDVLKATDTIHAKDVYCYDDGPGIINITGTLPQGYNREFTISGGKGLTMLDSISATLNPAMVGDTFNSNGTKKLTITYKYNISSEMFQVTKEIQIDSISTALDFEIFATKQNTDPLSYCNDDKPAKLNAIHYIPIGGSFEWLGGGSLVLGAGSIATVDPTKVGPGTYNILLRYTSPSGCVRTIIAKPFIVHAKPAVYFIGLLDNYDYALSSVPLQGNHSGGEFTGVGISLVGNILNPSASMLRDSNIITYKYTDPITLCENDTSRYINIVDAKATINIPDIICYWNGKILITGSAHEKYALSKDTLFGRGVRFISDTTAEFDPIVADRGLDTIYYQYEGNDINRTRFTVLKIIIVDKIDSITINGLKPQYCAATGQQSLTTNAPTGGTGKFSIPGITDTPKGFYNKGKAAYFYADTVMLLNDSLEYGEEIPLTFTYTSDLNCRMIVNKSLLINEVPYVQIRFNESCFDDKDSIHFFDDTKPEHDTIKKWKWDFGDLNVKSEDSVQNPYWKYSDIFTATVKLIVSTDNCSSMGVTTIKIGDKLKADFSWADDCYKETDPVQFSASINSPPNDPINSYKWEFSYNGITENISNEKAPNYQFQHLASYNVSLKATSSFGCTDSVEKTINLRPWVVLSDSDYSESFNQSQGGWFSYASSDADKNIWQLDVPSNNIFKSLPGERIWYTKIDTSISVSSSSVPRSAWVTSPCFDFTGVKKPMIKMKIWKAFDQNFDGGVLQYSDNAGNSWNVVGNKDEGINWYNSVSIYGKPGDQPQGWTGTGHGEASFDKSWTIVRLSLDSLINRSNVRFRVAYGLQQYESLITGGFAFDDIWIGERSKVLLLEHFTNLSDLSIADDKLDDEIYQYPSDFLDIRYHTDYPVDDIFAKAYLTGTATKALFYNLPGVPCTLIDGGFEENSLVNYSNLFWDNELVKKTIMQRILEDPEFSFNELKSEKTSTGIKVNIELTANDAINTGTTLHVAIVEKGVTINNSSAIYKNVLRKLMPDPAGTSYANWHLRQTEKIELSWNYFNITNPDSIRVIAFIQDDVTKEVYQAATDSLTFHTKKGIEAVVSKDSTFSLYPNPAKSLLNIIFEKPLCTVSTVQVYNQLGELVKSANIEKGTQIKQINIDALKGGLYFIRVNANGQLYRTEKLVILR